MKLILMVVIGFVVIIGFRPGCAKRNAVRDCALVCGDIGYEPGSALQTGFFTYECKCKKYRTPKGLIPVKP